MVGGGKMYSLYKTCSFVAKAIIFVEEFSHYMYNTQWTMMSFVLYMKWSIVLL